MHLFPLFYTGNPPLPVHTIGFEYLLSEILSEIYDSQKRLMYFRFYTQLKIRHNNLNRK